jgi:hypothetical protein
MGMQKSKEGVGIAVNTERVILLAVPSGNIANGMSVSRIRRKILAIVPSPPAITKPMCEMTDAELNAILWKSYKELSITEQDITDAACRPEEVEAALSSGRGSKQ